MDDSDDERFVNVRPYSAEVSNVSSRRPGPPPTKSAKDAGGSAASSGPKRFVPRPPEERRNVEEVIFASGAGSSKDPLAMLAAAQKLGPGRPVGAGDGPVVFRAQGTSLEALGVKGNGSRSAKSSGALFNSGIAAGAGRRTDTHRGEGKSKRLTDLAYQEEKVVNGRRKKYYNPISLPFYQTGDVDSEDEDREQSENATETRPKLAMVDEANKGAARRLFVDEDGDGGLRENQFFLMQLPAILPELANKDEEVQREEEDAATAGAGAAITRFPDGLIGKLRIHKSGKVRMDFGGVPFCVDQGCTAFFRQELALVDNKNTCFSLDEVINRVVLTPDIDAMFPTSAEPNASSYVGPSSAAAPYPAAGADPIAAGRTAPGSTTAR